MIIAIDGPAGSGKSTVAREVARRFGFEKLDTGALYRAVAVVCSEEGIDLADLDAVAARAEALELAFEATGEAARIAADGRDLSDEIRTSRVDRIVSAVATNPGVRHALLPAQRSFACGRDVVAEGRDIGTVVFPAAELKVFLTADPRERAHRRVAQRHEHDGAPAPADALAREEAETLADIERRDAADAANTVPAADAVRIDSTSQTIDEIVCEIGRLIAERRAS